MPDSPSNLIEQWNVTNNTSQMIMISIKNAQIPGIKPGQSLNLLQFATKDNISQSASLNRLLNNSNLILTKVEESDISDDLLSVEQNKLTDATEIKGNSLIVNNTDNLQAKYDWLKSSNRDASMGELSAENERTLYLSTGNYEDQIIVQLSPHVSIRYDEDVSGVVIDRSGLPARTHVDVLSLSTLTRSSVAYLNGTEYPANARRWNILPVSSSPDDMEKIFTITVTGVGSISAILWCKSGDYIYATDDTPRASLGYKGIFRSKDGEVWEQIQSITALTGLGGIFPAINGDILVSKTDVRDPVSGISFYYSSVGGSDLTDASMPTAVCEFSVGNSIGEASKPLSWNYYVSPHGTIMVGEYKSSTNEYTRKIWRSQDGGKSFSNIYELTQYSGGGPVDDNVQHCHVINYHAATGTWLVSYGDTPLSQTIISTDDGNNWEFLFGDYEEYDLGNEYYRSQEIQYRPTAYYDYGHATKILVGTDSYGQICTLDLVTKNVSQIYFNGIRDYSPYCFGFFGHDGLIYAGIQSIATTSVLTEAGRRISILVGQENSDGDVKFQVLYRFDAGEDVGAQYYWYNNGYIYVKLEATDDYTQYKFKLPSFDTYQGVAIDPGTVNLLTANQSSAETDTTGWSNVSTGTLERITTESLHGNACIRFHSLEANDTEGGTVLGPYITYNALGGEGSKYCYQISAKAQDTDGSNVYAFGEQYLSGQNTSESTPFTEPGYPPVYFVGSHEEWQELVYKPFTVSTATASQGRIRFETNMKCGPGGAGGLLLDCAQIEEGPPTRWHIGGGTRAYEKLSLSTTMPSTWTELILWAPHHRAEWYKIFGDMPIKTWYSDASNYIELYFDAVNNKIVLEVTDTGTSTGTVEVDVNQFYTDQPIFIAVICDGTNMELYISASKDIDSATGVLAESWMVSSTMILQTGNAAGDNVVSSTYLYDYLVPEVLDNTDITYIHKYLPNLSANTSYYV